MCAVFGFRLALKYGFEKATDAGIIHFIFDRYNKIALDADTSKGSCSGGGAEQDPVQDDDKTPLILKLADQMDQSDLSKTSLILSSLRFSSKTAATPSSEDGTTRAQSRRHIDKTLVFQHTGSPLLDCGVVKAALGTNHTAFIISKSHIFHHIKI